MYNEELKSRYIKENQERNNFLKNQATILFNRCELYEQKLDKDIASFSTSEIIDYLKSFNSISLESIMNAVSQYKLYVDWCIENNIFIKDKQNHFKELNVDMLNKCVNTYLLQQSIITREWILQNWDALINPCERFILLGAFEGVGSVSKIAYKEFEYLTMDSFNTDTHELILSPNHIIEYSDELYRVACEAADTYELISYDRHGNERHIRLLNDNRIIKPRINATVGDYKNIISKKLSKIKRELNNPAISLNALKESGRKEMVIKLIEGGMNIENALSDEKVVRTYGVVQAKKRWVRKYYAE